MGSRMRKKIRLSKILEFTHPSKMANLNQDHSMAFAAAVMKIAINPVTNAIVTSNG